MAYIDNVNKVLNIQPEAAPTRVRLSQNENGRNLYFTLAGNENPIPSGVTVTIVGTKPDGTVYSGTGSISNDVVLIPETVQLTAVAGVWDAKVKITSGGNTVATGRIRFLIDADTVAPGSVPSSSVLEGLVEQAQQYAETARQEAYGSPLTAALASDMTDKTRVYVYTGSESGKTAGHWYFWNGSAWTDGGVYNSTAVQTDKTLSLMDVPADGKAVGDAIAAVTIPTDKTLSIPDAPADAQTVGLKLSSIRDMIAGVETTTIATKNYAIGDLIVVFENDTLYEATKAITTGTQIKSVNAKVTTIDEAISSRITASIDNTLTQTGKAADAKVVGDEITSLKSHLEAIADVKLLNGFTELTEPGYYGELGEIIESSSFVHSDVYVEVKPSTEYSVWWARYAASYTYMQSACGVCFYDAGKTFISRVANTHTFTTPSACKYIRTYLSKNAYDTYAYSMLTKGTSKPSYYIPYGYDVITAYEEKCGESYDNSFSNELKLIDALTIADGTKEYTLDSETSKTATTGHYTNAIGVVTESASWNTYRCNIEPNAKYYVKASAASGAYAITVFDKNGKRLLALPSTLASSTLDGMIDTPATASYAILNASTRITVSLKKVIGIRLSTTVDTSANVLFGKKLYCGGDSITEGANVGSFLNGYKKTYGGFVATRNGMTYVADGVGGSTMGKCTIDGAVHNNFITSRYQNIPTDADYITLWFGWNDQAYGWKSARDAYCVATYGNYYTALTSAEQETVDAYKTWRQWLVKYAGTKDSTDITTWGGAWNTVLTWLLNNCDESHVGVVIAYGITDELSSVLIAICEKYGIPYVKAYDPHEFFSVGHSQGIGTDQATRRKAVYTLDNTHPNELGYEMMSNSYEQFLLRT